MLDCFTRSEYTECIQIVLSFASSCVTRIVQIRRIRLRFEPFKDFRYDLSEVVNICCYISAYYKSVRFKRVHTILWYSRLTCLKFSISAAPPATEVDSKRARVVQIRRLFDKCAIYRTTAAGTVTAGINKSRFVIRTYVSVLKRHRDEDENDYDYIAVGAIIASATET